MSKKTEGTGGFLHQWRFFLPLLGLLAVVLVLALSPRFSSLPRQNMGLSEVPEFSLPALMEGQPAFTRQVISSSPDMVLVNVWASWCTPCRVEHPQLMALSSQPNLVVAGIAYRDAPENARHFLAEFGNPFDYAALDESGEAMLNWGLFGVPESFLVAPDGTVLWRHFGPITPEILAQDLLPLLAANQPSAN